jgi:SET domain-containing protein
LKTVNRSAMVRRSRTIRAHGFRTDTSQCNDDASQHDAPPVLGRGVFALQPIAAGERLIEYAGEVSSWPCAAARQRSENGHTFVFGLSDGRVIDGSRGGNSARFINHDYGLAVDGETTDELRAHYACHCGVVICRRSMLAGADTAQ